MPYAKPPEPKIEVALTIKFEEAPDFYDVKPNVNRATGQIWRTYLYKRKPCHRAELTSHLSRQLAGYTLIEKDLRSALAWAKQIHELRGPKEKRSGFGVGKDREKYLLIKGFTVAAMTFYGKCFAQADGRRVKLEKKQLEKSFHGIHDQLIQYRNNFAAHSGVGDLEECNVVAVFPTNSKIDVEPKVYVEINQPDVVDHADPKRTMLKLFEHVQELVEQKLIVLREKVNKEVKEMSKVELIKLANK